MTTSILDAEIILSKQLGDYWSSVTTGTGSSATNIQDTALKAKANDWITDETYIMITDEDAENDTDEEERKATALDNSSGDLTVFDLSGDPGDGITYRIHRLFTASEKRRALVHSAKWCFPHIFKEIWDESLAIDDDDLYKEIDISGLGLAKNLPHQIWQSSDKTDDGIAWYPIRDYTVDKDGNLWLHRGTCDYDLRIVGIGYLDFLDGDDVVGTDWEDTIDIDSPQTEILVAGAAVYLCNQMIVPNFTSGTSEGWKEALKYWQGEYRDRYTKFGMSPPNAMVSWRV